MDSYYDNFTNSQRRAYDVIISGVDIFVTGGAGTGKSYLVREVIKAFEKEGKNVVVCAPTGAAAVAIGGVTIHRAFGYAPGPCITKKTHNLVVHTPKLIRMADIIIIDEISMCRIDMMDAISASILKARQVSTHKIQIVVVGDFCQLPPVINESSGERELLEAFYNRPIGSGFAFQSEGWKKIGFKTVELVEIVRQNNKEFITALNRIRMGDTGALEYINGHALFQKDVSAVSLYPFNYSVNRINRKELQNLPGGEVVFNPVCGGRISDISILEPVYLKPGAKVVITTNDCGACISEKVDTSTRHREKDTFYNGTGGVIVEASLDKTDPSKDYVVVRLNTGQMYLFYRKTQYVYDYRVDKSGRFQREVVGYISQIPVILGYAVTIHRSQGQSYGSINLNPSCGYPGQLYVALSRLKDISGLHLLSRIEPFNLNTDPLVIEFYNQIRLTEKSESAFKSSSEIPIPEEKHEQFQYTEKCETKKDSKKTKRTGRPLKYPNGSRVIRVPAELSDELNTLLNTICPKGRINTEELERFRAALHFMCTTNAD